MTDESGSVVSTPRIAFDEDDEASAEQLQWLDNFVGGLSESPMAHGAQLIRFSRGMDSRCVEARITLRSTLNIKLTADATTPRSVTFALDGGSRGDIELPDVSSLTAVGLLSAIVAALDRPRRGAGA